MSPAHAVLKANVVMPSDETTEAAAIVEKFLVASMVPDPETAARYIAEPLKLTFTGGRKFRIGADPVDQAERGEDPVPIPGIAKPAGIDHRLGCGVGRCEADAAAAFEMQR